MRGNGRFSIFNMDRKDHGGGNGQKIRENPRHPRICFYQKRPLITVWKCEVVGRNGRFPLTHSVVKNNQ